jgi:hypothetical protein
MVITGCSTLIKISHNNISSLLKYRPHVSAHDQRCNHFCVLNTAIHCMHIDEMGLFNHEVHYHVTLTEKEKQNKNAVKIRSFIGVKISQQVLAEPLCNKPRLGHL